MASASASSSAVVSVYHSGMTVAAPTKKVTDPKMLALFQRRAPAVPAAGPLAQPMDPSRAVVASADPSRAVVAPSPAPDLSPSSLLSTLHSVDLALTTAHLLNQRTSGPVGTVVAVTCRGLNTLRGTGDLFDAFMNFAPDGSNSINSVVVKPAVKLCLDLKEYFEGNATKRLRNCNKAAKALVELFEDWITSQCPIIIQKIERYQEEMLLIKKNSPLSSQELAVFQNEMRELNELKGTLLTINAVISTGLFIFDNSRLKKSLISKFGEILRGLDKKVRLEQGYMMAQPVVKACLMTALGPAGFLTNHIPVIFAGQIGEQVQGAQEVLGQLQLLTKASNLYDAASIGKAFLAMRFLEPILERYMLIRELIGTMMLPAPASYEQSSEHGHRIVGREYGFCASFFCDPVKQVESSSGSSLVFPRLASEPFESNIGSSLCSLVSAEYALKLKVDQVVHENWGGPNPEHPRARLLKLAGSSLAATKAKVFMAQLYLAKSCLVGAAKTKTGQEIIRKFFEWWNAPSTLPVVLALAEATGAAVGVSAADASASAQLGGMVSSAIRPVGMRLNSTETATFGATLLVAQLMTSFSVSGAVKGVAVAASATEFGMDMLTDVILNATQGLQNGVQSGVQNQVFKLAFVLKHYSSETTDLQRISEELSAPEPSLAVLPSFVPPNDLQMVIQSPKEEVVPPVASSSSSSVPSNDLQMVIPSPKEVVPLVAPSSPSYFSFVGDAIVSASKKVSAAASEVGSRVSVAANKVGNGLSVAASEASRGLSFAASEVRLAKSELREIDRTWKWLQLQLELQQELTPDLVPEDESLDSDAAASALVSSEAGEGELDSFDFESDDDDSAESASSAAVAPKKFPDKTVEDFLKRKLLADAQKLEEIGRTGNPLRPLYWNIESTTSLRGKTTWRVTTLNEKGLKLFQRC